ncbi:MAG: hypothetical protein IT355_17320 [Gemmatimonadaceae bacterium]|nr:hypothetical protein [Gemmatimonadaceae bacterium]
MTGPDIVRLRRALAPSLLLVLLPTVPLAAQQSRQMPEQAGFGIRGVNAQPAGEFKRYVNSGWGIGGDGRWFPGHQKALALRGDLQFVTYGRAKTRECFGTGCRIVIDITTSNNIFTGVAGPELQLPSGPIRPYVNALAGLTSFWTQSSADGRDNSNENVFSTTNLRDNLFTRTAGAGVRIAVAGMVLIDVGAQRHFNGRARYLTRDSFGDGTLTTPLVRESDVDMWTYSIGVSFGR